MKTCYIVYQSLFNPYNGDEEESFDVDKVFLSIKDAEKYIKNKEDLFQAFLDMPTMTAAEYFLVNPDDDIDDYHYNMDMEKVYKADAKHKWIIKSHDLFTENLI